MLHKFLLFLKNAFTPITQSKDSKQAKPAPLWFICWCNHTSREFNTELVAVCKRLGWGESHASWLMACIAFETNRTFSPSIKNFAGSGATGLIQFMPRTAESLGTSTEELAQMTPTAQLRYVEKYFRPYKTKIANLNDMYMAILMPKYIGRRDDTHIFKKGIAYRQNVGLDLNKDGAITKREACYKVGKLFHEGFKEGNSKGVYV